MLTKTFLGKKPTNQRNDLFHLFPVYFFHFYIYKQNSIHLQTFALNVRSLNVRALNVRRS